MKPLLEDLSSQWPPAPHDPRERTRVGRIDRWEVRFFSRLDAQHKHFESQAFMHLQLWNPAWKFSILTPSPLTGNFYELFPFRGAKLPICCLTTVNTVLQQQLRVPGIDPQTLQFMMCYFLSNTSRQTMRTHSTILSIPYGKNED